MSNTLFITVIKFQSVEHDDVSYGFTASDNYASFYQDGWESLEEFFAAYPTEEALREYVLTTEAFDSFDSDTSGSIVVSFPNAKP